MKMVRNRALVTVMVIIMILFLFTGTFVYAAAKTALSQTKITVQAGKTKTIKVKNAGEKVSWKVISGKKNISIIGKKSSIEITGKRTGEAKLQVKTRGRKLTCEITVKDKKKKDAAGFMITVESDKYTIVYQLNDSKAAKSLYQQLPLTLEVENYSDNEKIFYPSEELETKDTPKAKGKKGSLAYYEPWGDVVMFYESAGSASGLYELGTVVSGENDISKLSGEITINKAD